MISQTQSFQEPWSQISQPTAVSQVKGTTLVTIIHIAYTSPTSINHVGDEPLEFASHDESMSPATVSHVGCIHMIEKPRRIVFKPKLLCRICKGNHLTHQCHDIDVALEVQSLPDSPLGSESSLVSQHYKSSFVNTTFKPMQSLADTTSVLRSGASSDHVIKISSLVPFEQERVLLSLSMLPPSPREVSFDWDGLVGYQIPSSTTF
jgi:hypothetical protein